MTENHQGWIKLHRRICDSDLWLLEPFTKAQAWVDLFLNANHDTTRFSVRGNIVTVNRGQLGWSEVTMSKRWRWSRQKVRRFLELLEKTEKIAQQKSTLTTIISICNYDTYQGSRTTDDTTDATADDTTERQQKDSRRYTYKNVKNEKNERIEDISAPAKADGTKKRFRKPEISELREYVVSIGLPPSEAERIYDSYESKGWVVGKSPMKDWKASTRNWARNKNLYSLPRQDEDPMAGLRACN